MIGNFSLTDVPHQILGCSLALLSAFFWALGSVLFHSIGEKAPAAAMNLMKCLLGCVYIGILLLVFGTRQMDTRSFLFLGLSGILGISLGDTFFFKALKDIGPKPTILLGTLGPVFTLLLAGLFLREKISLPAGLGILCVLAGINTVVWRSHSGTTEKRQWLRGITFAALSGACTAAAVILAKIGVETADSLQGTWIRLFWSGAVLLTGGIAAGKIRDWTVPFMDKRTMLLSGLTVFIVIFGGFWLSLLSLKLIGASISTTLNFTTPLFILPLAALFLKQKATRMEIIGSLIAVAGIALIFYFPA